MCETFIYRIQCQVCVSKTVMCLLYLDKIVYTETKVTSMDDVIFFSSSFLTFYFCVHLSHD